MGALLVLVFSGFLFVTVSARLTGEIGSSSNPISGMTARHVITHLLDFLTFGMTSPTERVLAISIAGVVCIAASNRRHNGSSLEDGLSGRRYAQGDAVCHSVWSLSFLALIIGYTLLLIESSQYGV